MNRKKWSKDKIVLEISDMQARGILLNWRSAAEAEPDIVANATRLFGSWNAAVIAAGIELPSPIKRKGLNFDKHAVVVEIQRMQRQHEPLNAYATRHLPVFAASLPLFGTWENAIKAAGIDYSDIMLFRKWTPGLVKFMISSLYKNSVDISSHNTQIHNSPLFNAGCRLFGSWQKAVEASGISYEDVRLNVSGGLKRKSR